MRAAAILGPGNVAKSLIRFQQATLAQWTSLLEQADVVVIFGGDGTVHRHLSTLVEIGVPVLIVPCGSGNDFARALGIRTWRDSVSAWHGFVASNTFANIDLGVVKGQACAPGNSTALGPNEARTNHDSTQYFCCVAGVGIDGAIIRRANALPSWFRSHGGYALSTPQEIFHFTPFPMRISLSGTTAGSQPTILAAIANAPAFGGGMKIAPQAKLDDAHLDVCVVRAMNAFKLFCLFPTIYFGRHLNFCEVEYSQTPAARIETEFPFEVYADGEYVCQTPAEFSLAPSALKVIAGASASLSAKCYTSDTLCLKTDARASGSGY
jgi:diacylglycerol kinase (ATP)